MQLHPNAWGIFHPSRGESPMLSWLDFSRRGWSFSSGLSASPVLRHAQQPWWPLHPHLTELGSIHQIAARLVPLLIGFTTKGGLLFPRGLCPPHPAPWVNWCAWARLQTLATRSQAKVMAAVPGMVYCSSAQQRETAAAGPAALLQGLVADRPLSPIWEGPRRFWGGGF